MHPEIESYAVEWQHLREAYEAIIQPMLTYTPDLIIVRSRRLIYLS
jgi:hypothetical protein